MQDWLALWYLVQAPHNPVAGHDQDTSSIPYTQARRCHLVQEEECHLA
jgi:hypothetical protein